MEQTYTQAQLISFGNYLLNTDRVQDAMGHARVGSDGELDTEFITQVYDADLANWSLQNGLAYDPNGDIKDTTHWANDIFNDDQG